MNDHVLFRSGRTYTRLVEISVFDSLIHVDVYFVFNISLTPRPNRNINFACIKLLLGLLFIQHCYFVHFCDVYIKHTHFHSLPL